MSDCQSYDVNDADEKLLRNAMSMQRLSNQLFRKSANLPPPYHLELIEMRKYDISAANVFRGMGITETLCRMVLYDASTWRAVCGRKRHVNRHQRGPFFVFVLSLASWCNSVRVVRQRLHALLFAAHFSVFVG